MKQNTVINSDPNVAIEFPFFGRKMSLWNTINMNTEMLEQCQQHEQVNVNIAIEWKERHESNIKASMHPFRLTKKP